MRSPKPALITAAIPHARSLNLHILGGGSAYYLPTKSYFAPPNLQLIPPLFVIIFHVPRHSVVLHIIFADRVVTAKIIIAIYFVGVGFILIIRVAPRVPILGLCGRGFLLAFPIFSSFLLSLCFFNSLIHLKLSQGLLQHYNFLRRRFIPISTPRDKNYLGLNLFCSFSICGAKRIL